MLFRTGRVAGVNKSGTASPATWQGPKFPRGARSGAGLLGSAGEEPGSAGVEPGSSGGGAGLHPGEEPGSTPGSRGARLRFGLLAGSWARATWPDWLCRICSPQPPYPPSKAHFPPPVGVVREVNKSGTADTALKTRLPSIYSGAPPLRSPAPPRGAGLPPEGSRPKFLGELPIKPREK